METRNENRFTPFMAVHPGGILEMELEDRGIKQKDFAKQIGMLPSNLNRIIKGKSPITENIAEKIEEALNIRKELWLRYQKDYEYDSFIIAQRQKDKTSAVKDKQPASVISLLQSINDRLGILISMQSKNDQPGFAR
ncbi:MAG: HigA family addiction module antidote protein [Bacteroidales bacterium]|nr:HigA family addiction module antidote protein [Bacteroidales bacterium]